MKNVKYWNFNGGNNERLMYEKYDGNNAFIVMRKQEAECYKEKRNGVQLFSSFSVSPVLILGKYSIKLWSVLVSFCFHLILLVKGILFSGV